MPKIAIRYEISINEKDATKLARALGSPLDGRSTLGMLPTLLQGALASHGRSAVLEWVVKGETMEKAEKLIQRGEIEVGRPGTLDW